MVGCHCDAACHIQVKFGTRENFISSFGEIVISFNFLYLSKQTLKKEDSMSEDLKLVYTGSIIEAGYLAELLEENNLTSILRGSLSESVIAGWASGSPEDAARLYVETAHAEAAKMLIEGYLKSR